MSVISRCPRCHAWVTIPDGLDAEAEVRCPLCVVVYPLREALAELPPALIPVLAGTITGPHPGSEALAGSDLVTEPYQMVEPPPTAEGAVTTREAAPEEAPMPGAWQDFDGAAEVDTQTGHETSPVIDTGQTPVDADALAAFGRDASSREYEPVAGRPPARPLTRKKEKGAIRFLMEVVLGGVVGLTIGYYVVCWVLGPRHGLPELPLPLLPHTMHWLKGSEEPDAAAGRSSAGGAETPRPGVFMAAKCSTGNSPVFPNAGWKPALRPPMNDPG